MCVLCLSYIILHLYDVSFFKINSCEFNIFINVRYEEEWLTSFGLIKKAMNCRTHRIAGKMSEQIFNASLKLYS